MGRFIVGAHGVGKTGVGISAHGAFGDAGDPAVLAAAVERCEGRIGALVCSAGIPPSGPWDSREHWDEVIAVDLAAPYEALRTCWPALVAGGGSTVLWRLYRANGAMKGDRIRAVMLPGGPPYTLAFFSNEDMDRVENYDSLDLAMFRSDEIKQGLLADDWKED